MDGAADIISHSEDSRESDNLDANRDKRFDRQEVRQNLECKPVISYATFRVVIGLAIICLSRSIKTKFSSHEKIVKML